MEAQAHRGLSLPEKGKPFLNYPNETRRGAEMPSISSFESCAACMSPHVRLSSGNFFHNWPA